MSYNYPKHVLFQCTKCALCCGDTKTRTRHILLLRGEAEHISNVASKPIHEFADKINDHEPYVYEMKKTAEEGKCLFLTAHACIIYESRPLICRFYPFQLKTTKNRKSTFLCTNECPGTGKGKRLGKEYYEDLFRQAHDSLQA